MSDKEIARDILLKLLEIAKDPFVALSHNDKVETWKVDDLMSAFDKIHSAVKQAGQK